MNQLHSKIPEHQIDMVIILKALQTRRATKIIQRPRGAPKYSQLSETPDGNQRHRTSIVEGASEVRTQAGV